MASSAAHTIVVFKPAERDAPEVSRSEEALWLIRHFFGTDATAARQRILSLVAQAREKEGQTHAV